MPTRLAVIGDSLAQGFQDGAIGNGFPLRSFPATIARCLGLEVGTGPGAGFRVPNIPGDGLPLDLVALLRRVAERTGPDIGLLEWPAKALPEIARYFDELEGYYEVGPGSRPSPATKVSHNLAAYGLTVFESLKLTSAECDKLIEESEGWFRDDILGTPSGAKFRAAKLILDPDGTRPNATQLDNLDELVRGSDPPEALIVWLGANDALGTVVELELRDMAGEATPNLTLEGRRAYNLTSAQQFRADYLELAARIDAIVTGRNIQVFVGTVPDVSIPPIAKGLGELRDDVFDFYVRFFVKDGATPPPFHKRLRRGQVEEIQQRIASFNETVRDVVSTRAHWHLVDIAGVLQQLAVRRNYKQPHEPLRDYYTAKGRPDHPLLTQLSPTPSLLTLRTDENGKRTAGGLTSLDGVHPTTIGYGIAAEVFLEAMQAAGIASANPLAIDWMRLIEEDRLATKAPATWDDFLDSAEAHSLLWDTLFRTLSSRV